MTIKAVLINAGNRTGDVLEVHVRTPEQDGWKLRHSIKRGQSVRLNMHEEVKLKSTYASKDKFKGDVQIMVADEPENDDAIA